MLNPGFRSGTALNPFQILLALTIKTAGFFIPRLSNKKSAQLETKNHASRKADKHTEPPWTRQHLD